MFLARLVLLDAAERLVRHMCVQAREKGSEESLTLFSHRTLDTRKRLREIDSIDPAAESDSEWSEFDTDSEPAEDPSTRLGWRE